MPRPRVCFVWVAIGLTIVYGSYLFIATSAESPSHFVQPPSEPLKSADRQRGHGQSVHFVQRKGRARKHKKYLGEGVKVHGAAFGADSQPDVGVHQAEELKSNLDYDLLFHFDFKGARPKVSYVKQVSKLIFFLQ